MGSLCSCNAGGPPVSKHAPLGPFSGFLSIPQLPMNSSQKKKARGPPPSHSLTLSPENQAGGLEGRGVRLEARGQQRRESKKSQAGIFTAQSPRGRAPRLLNNAVLNSIKAIICCAK